VATSYHRLELEASMPMRTDFGERTGENEALFREVNERLKDRKKDDPGWALPSRWICECADDGCTERFEMSPLEYEELRSEPTHFGVFPSEEHVSPDVERVVEQHDGYWVVEKIGEAAEVAEETDPRVRAAQFLVSGLALRPI
jgi:hypothetical protein